MSRRRHTPVPATRPRRNADASGERIPAARRCAANTAFRLRPGHCWSARCVPAYPRRASCRPAPRRLSRGTHGLAASGSGAWDGMRRRDRPNLKRGKTAWVGGTRRLCHALSILARSMLDARWDAGAGSMNVRDIRASVLLAERPTYPPLLTRHTKALERRSAESPMRSRLLTKFQRSRVCEPRCMPPLRRLLYQSGAWSASE